MAKYVINDATLTGIANAIREKAGSAEPIRVNEMAEKVRGITAGLDTSDADATADDIAMGKTAYVDGEKVTGRTRIIDSHEYADAVGFKWVDDEGVLRVHTQYDSRCMIEAGVDLYLDIEGYKLGDATDADVAEGKTYTSENGIKRTGTKQEPLPVTQATPIITVNDNGLITAKSTQGAGLVSAGTKQATKQLTTQAAQTITPGTSSKTIDSGRYLTGTQTIKGDTNLKAENIKAGVSIFGVTGSYRGDSSGGSSDCNCDDISVENGTCTVEVIADGEMHFSGAEMTYVEWDDDGTANLVEWFHEEWVEADWSFEYENVVCGSYFLLHATKNGFDSYEAENAKLLCHFLWGEYKLFRITAPPGGKATIRMIGTE